MGEFQRVSLGFSFFSHAGRHVNVWSTKSSNF